MLNQSTKATPTHVESPSESATETARQTRLRKLVGSPIAWLAFWLLLGAGCFWFGFGASDSANSSTATQPSRYKTKDMADIRKGDIVMARDEFGNELGLKRVVEVYHHTSDHLRILTFRAPDGSTQTLKTTNEHPFWIEERQDFVDAEEMQIGDTLKGPHGEIETVVSTVYEPHPNGIPVYNFQVEDYHTYFVQQQGARAPPVLVHNADCAPKGIPTGIKRFASSDQPVVLIGRDMKRVDRAAAQLRAQGINVKTWNPKNFDGLANPLEANRSWLRYWAKEKGARVIDIGQGSISKRSDFYDMELRSVYKNWKDVIVFKWDTGF